MKNKIIFVVLFLYSSYLYADLKCSAKGTQLFYVNGINVSSQADAEKTSIIIKNTLDKSSLVIDLTKIERAETVHNISLGFINDILETKNELLANKSGEPREELYEQMLRSELGIPVRMEVVESFKTDNEKTYDRVRAALLRSYSKYKIKNKAAYDFLSKKPPSLTEPDLIENLSLFNEKLQKGIRLAVADRFVIDKVKFKITEALKQNLKVIFIAHSQGNEVLRSAVREIEENPTQYFSSFEEFDRTMNKVFGALQVAPPSPALIYCPNDSVSCRSQEIKLAEDLIIKNGNLVMAFFPGDYSDLSVSPNYKMDKVKTSYSYVISNPLNAARAGMSLFFDLMSPSKGALIHSMDNIYLNSKVHASAVSGGSSSTMTEIFSNKVVSVAETLENNCGPKAVINAIKFSDSSYTFDAINPDNEDLTDLKYFWNMGDGTTYTRYTPKPFMHNYSKDGIYNVSVTVTDQYEQMDVATTQVTALNTFGNLTICNGGIVPITMTFTSPEISSFSLDHINYYDENGAYLNSTCECKTLSIPQNRQVGIHVEGSGVPDFLNTSLAGILPYDGYVTAQSDIQYFTIAPSTDLENNLLYYVVVKDAAYGITPECQNYSYK